MRYGAVSAMVILLVAASPAWGHHSEAGFDTEAAVAFQGTVTRFGWRNPHVYIDVEATDDAGKSVGWTVETGATPILMRSGWTRDSLSPGDAVTVRGHPERNTGRNYALLLTIDKADGTVLSQSDGDPQAVASASDLSGTWRGCGPSIAAFRERLARVALTEKGAAAKAEYDFYSDSPSAMCIRPSTSWVVTSTLYVSAIDFREDTVSIRSEFFDADRTVFMDGRAHPENGERTNQGHSIGWWEDDVLVIDTRLFADHRTGNGSGVPSGAQKHVIEKFRLSEDRTRAIIDVFLEDPEYLAEPFMATLEWS